MSHIAATTVSSVTKEDISQFQFPQEEVLASPEQREQRRHLLERSVILGNTFKGKAKIIFEDNECVRQVETHIWGLTDKRVILKQGIVIPIHRIHEVKL